MLECTCIHYLVVLILMKENPKQTTFTRIPHAFRGEAAGFQHVFLDYNVHALRQIVWLNNDC